MESMNKLIGKYTKRIMIDYPDADKIHMDLVQFAQELRQPLVVKSVCDKCEELEAELSRCYEAMDSKQGING